MQQPTGPSISERIKTLRGKLSQVALAERAGVSVDLIRILERGKHENVTVANLQKLARALDVDAADLLPKTRPALAEVGPTSGAVALRQAVTSVDDLINQNPIELGPITLDAARRAASYGWSAYWRGRTHDQLPQVLPRALALARATVRDVPTAERAAANEVAAQVYQLAACTLVHLGYLDSAYLAAREGLAYAQHGDDPRLPLSMQGTISWVLLNGGRFEESHKVATSAAAAVEAADDSVPSWTLYGHLVMTGATAASRGQDRDMAGVLLAEAEDAARRTGFQTHYETAFGPDQVAMQRVDMEIVTERYSAALRAAQRMPRELELPLAARVRHMADVALVNTRLGRDEAALDILTRIEAVAPEWLAAQRHAQQIIRELWARSINPRLVQLAHTAGIIEER